MAIQKESLDGRQFHRHDVSLEEVNNNGIHNEVLMLEDTSFDVGEEDETIENYCSDNENISSKDNDKDVN